MRFNEDYTHCTFEETEFRGKESLRYGHKKLITEWGLEITMPTKVWDRFKDRFDTESIEGKGWTPPRHYKPSKLPELPTVDNSLSNCPNPICPNYPNGRPTFYQTNIRIEPHSYVTCPHCFFSQWNTTTDQTIDAAAMWEEKCKKIKEAIDREIGLELDFDTEYRRCRLNLRLVTIKFISTSPRCILGYEEIASLLQGRFVYIKKWNISISIDRYVLLIHHPIFTQGSPELKRKAKFRWMDGYHPSLPSQFPNEDNDLSPCSQSQCFKKQARIRVVNQHTEEEKWYVVCDNEDCQFFIGCGSKGKDFAIESWNRMYQKAKKIKDAEDSIEPENDE